MRKARKEVLRRITAGMLAGMLAAGMMLSAGAAEVKEESITGWEDLLATKYGEDSYHTSLEKHAGAETIHEGVTLQGDMATVESIGVELGDGMAKLGANAKAVYEVTVEKSGFYRLAIRYQYISENSLEDSDLGITVDGESPFQQAGLLELRRQWKQAPIEHRESANDAQSDAEHVMEPATYIPADASGMEGDYLFYLSAGMHKLGLQTEAGEFAILSLQVGVSREAALEDKGYGYTGDVIELEAEDMYRKNDSSITGGVDRTDPATTPNDYMYKKINTLDGSKYLKPGQAVTWKFEVEKDGKYQINFRYLQDGLPGLFAARNLYIDGQPIAVEADAVRFGYTEKWQLATVTDTNGDVLTVDLPAGEHTLTLEVSLGPLQSYVQRIDEVIFGLNTLYRKIIMITSTSPDVYRDYALEEEIPFLIPCFEEIYKELEAICDELEAFGASGGMLSILNQVIEQLKEFCEDSYYLQERLGQYTSNISSLSSLITELQETPVSIDRIFLESSEESTVAWKASFWESLWFQVQAFFGSFICDYAVVGDVAEGAKEEIVTWVSGSREMTELLQDIITEQFAEQEKDIAVQVKLVSVPLTNAILAGIAPDLMLSGARADPVTLGVRGVLKDLSDFADFGEIEERFTKNLLRPYQWKGATYGLPVALDYDVMFYRTDIFEELGFEIPETWDELYALIPKFQKNNLYVGLSNGSGGTVGNGIFATLLLQNGIEPYTEDLSEMLLDDERVAKVFKEWTELYTKYGLDLEFNALNRFRTGEMPLLVTSYSFYNQFAATAPEIKGLWKMALTPGTRKEDGTIDRSQAATTTTTYILEGSKHQEASWKFVKWWVSAEAQGAYGNAIETLFGVASRYNPVDPEAVKLLSWTDEEYELLMKQRESIVEMPEILGSYYITRSITNAFRNVVYSGANYKEQLLTQNTIINTEIDRKQKQYE